MDVYNSQYYYKDLLNAAIQKGSKFLDIGCGVTMIPTWMRDSVALQQDWIDRSTLAIGYDIFDSRPHVAGLSKFNQQGTKRFADATFTLITANMVMEHVKDPIEFLIEVRRLLKPKGMFIFHTPNKLHPLVAVSSWVPADIKKKVASFLDERAEEDIFETYYRLNTGSLITSIAKDIGFETLVLDTVKTGPLLNKIPIARNVESLFLHHGPDKYQADLVVALSKTN